MKFREMPSQEVLKELIDYDPETGLAFWKERGPHWFINCVRSAEWEMRRWNSANAGNPLIRETKHRYISIALFGKKYFLHRLIWKFMTGEEPNFIDHENGIRNDNRWLNLRNVSKQVNGQNLKKPRTNTSGHMGVRKKADCIRWQARCKKDGKEIVFGYFDSFEEAVSAWEIGIKKLGFQANHGRLEPMPKESLAQTETQ